MSRPIPRVGRPTVVVSEPQEPPRLLRYGDRAHLVASMSDLDAGAILVARACRGVVPVHGSLAVYPGTFDPFTPGHRDLVARARVMFDRIIVLLAVNADKRPTAEASARAVRVREAMPAAWGDVEVDTWTGRHAIPRTASKDAVT